MPTRVDDMHDAYRLYGLLRCDDCVHVNVQIGVYRRVVSLIRVSCFVELLNSIVQTGRVSYTRVMFVNSVSTGHVLWG